MSAKTQFTLNQEIKILVEQLAHDSLPILETELFTSHCGDKVSTYQNFFQILFGNLPSGSFRVPTKEHIASKWQWLDAYRLSNEISVTADIQTNIIFKKS